MKANIVLFVLVIFCQFIYGQNQYTTQSAQLNIFSKAPLENIEATSVKGRGGIDIESGQILFVVPIKSFEFKKKLMEKHFNENYLESDKYPMAKFEGSFSSPVAGGYTNENQTVDFKGTITIHGVSKEINETVKLNFQQGKVEAYSKFILKTKDFDIKIPRILIKNIAEEIEVEITATLNQVKS